MKDLKRQCKNCPWKIGASTDKIPGYSRAQHEALICTIAEPSACARMGPIRMMACHDSKEGADRMCVGWAANQLGTGNNVALRLRAQRDDRLQGLQTVGPQRERFEDTLK